MGQPKIPKPVKLVMSLIMASGDLFPRVLEDLGRCYGSADFTGLWMDFDFTDYYAPELGPFLKRRVVAFQKLIAPDRLRSVKHQTNVIEKNYSHLGKRQVNIDPGYVSGEHVILATTKPYTHRPYLGDGIYADLTLIFQKGSFRSLEWTYPDYGRADMIKMLNGIRENYLEQLKKETPAGVS
jgi:hypothetical protein